MIANTLIPFGEHGDTGELVDVGSVANGVSCNCVCPSCRTILVAKQGNVKEWHFAHKVQKSHNSTAKVCDYSFYVSLRMMIRQLSEDGLFIRVPSLDIPYSFFNESSERVEEKLLSVTSESVLQVENVRVGVPFQGVVVDVLTNVKGYDFVFYVSYKDRHVPLELTAPQNKRVGVVEISAEVLKSAFRTTKNGRYKETLKAFLSDNVNGKFWSYHPRYDTKKLQAEELTQHANELKSDAEFKKRKKWKEVPLPADWGTSKSSTSTQFGFKMGRFHCHSCGHKWRTNAVTSVCPKCFTEVSRK